ncbi:unnamed protein product [Orchesella dallaii]|uniref:CRAL-TRIO domain-containing protein n=1 Tax=Orchesella dallaii TaxID=48710 RepID=A0ABP1QUV9_9HEXA
METRKKPICPMDSIIFNDKKEERAYEELKRLIEGYIIEGKLKTDTCQKLICHLEKIKGDTKLLLDYIRCRKDNVNDAWQTIKTYVECRFIHYSNFFRDENDEITEKTRWLIRKHVCGMLKNLDKHGRLIIYIDTSKWDINEFSMDDVATAIIVGCESYWREPSVQNNGIVVVTNSGGFSGAHAKRFNLHKMIRLRNIHKSFPVSLQGIFGLEMNITMRISTNLVMPLFPRKLTSRVSLLMHHDTPLVIRKHKYDAFLQLYTYSPNEKPTELHEVASPEILPDWMGGKLSIEEASEDESYLEKKLNVVKAANR